MSANKLIRHPSKIASALDWKKASGAILSLDVGTDRIGVAVASHPCHGDAPLALEPVPLHLETLNNKRVLSPVVARQLQEIVKRYNVSSFVVSWPVQKEGRCGAPCGKVLHTLDCLVEDSTTNLITDKRPFCLWDEHHYQAPEDQWGRNPLYGEPPSNTKTLHSAKQEQYQHKTSSTVAAQVMVDFMRHQWPEIYEQREQPDEASLFAPSASSKPLSKPAETNFDWLEHYESTDSYMSVAV
jgi:RNase H-fold protein (predicted Holliday junction resolvase)